MEFSVVTHKLKSGVKPASDAAMVVALIHDFKLVLLYEYKPVVDTRLDRVKRNKPNGSTNSGILLPLSTHCYYIDTLFDWLVPVVLLYKRERKTIQYECTEVQNPRRYHMHIIHMYAIHGKMADRTCFQLRDSHAWVSNQPRANLLHPVTKVSAACYMYVNIYFSAVWHRN